MQQTQNLRGPAESALLYDASRRPISNFLLPAAGADRGVDLSSAAFTGKAIRKIALTETPLQLSEQFQKEHAPVQRTLFGKLGAVLADTAAVLASFPALAGFDLGRLIGRGWSLRPSVDGKPAREDADVPNIAEKAAVTGLASLTTVAAATFTGMVSVKLVPGALFCAALYAVGTALLGARRGYAAGLAERIESHAI